MSLDRLTTEMRETSASYDINLTINTSISDEISKLTSKKNDIISFICKIILEENLVMYI